MVDPEHPMDPVDSAYCEAETLLADDRARGERRVRVMAGITRIDDAASTTPTAPTRRPSWRGGGWLAAASVVGLSVFVATRLQSPSPPGAPNPGATVAAAPSEKASPPPPVSAPLAAAAVADHAPDANLPTKTAPRPQAFAAPPRQFAPPSPESEDHVTANDAATAGAAGGREEALSDRAVASQPPAPPAVSNAAVAPLRAAPQSASNFAAKAVVDPARRLRAAAAAGRTAEVEDLLAQGVRIDAPDAGGDTALMKAVEAGHWQTAASLRRRGASLDRKNRAGRSVRDVAEAMDNDEAALALGLR